jgi:hypothetical protein
MQTGLIGLRTGSWCALKALAVAVAVACSSSEQAETVVADTLAAACAQNSIRGSVLVARPDPAEEESQVSFKLLGDGAGPGVVLCRNVLYADADTLLALMGESATVAVSDGQAVIDGRTTQIQAYVQDGISYVALDPFARSRQALLVQRTEHRMDATLWPKATLLHMKALGPSRRGLYDSAVSKGLLPE